MPDQNPAVVTATKHVIASVEEQISDLQPGLQRQVEIATTAAELGRLKALVDASGLGAARKQSLSNAIATTSAIQTGAQQFADFGSVLLDLYSFKQSLQAALGQQEITNLEEKIFEATLLTAINMVKQLLNYRPDVGTIMDDLTAMKELRGGPADATAFHDFYVLQLAFKSVWLHAFDESFATTVSQLYETVVRLYDEAGLVLPDFGALNDINDLNVFINEIQKTIDPEDPTSALVAPPSSIVTRFFPQAVASWYLLSDLQRWSVEYWAAQYVTQHTPLEAATSAIDYYINHPDGHASRLVTLISEISKFLSEPYAFDVFAPNSYNFGLMITYRQKWEPGPYQAGDLVATIPLAPNETRKFSKKRVVKTTRAEKVIEKSVASSSYQTSEASRAELEIMQKATTATNFKLNVHGSFNIEVGSVDATTDFSVNHQEDSARNKKEFHEATRKAAEEYRLERSIEVDTSSTTEIEETSSGEISNPNNEITVTYMFYELQRRFTIEEFLYRVRPVILVAQDVPAPNEIDEAWLIQYQWILSRVLLDDSLRSALVYLTSGFAGDEVSVEVLKAQWETQARLVQSLEGQVRVQLVERDVARGQLEGSEIDAAIAQSKITTNTIDIAKNVLTGGGLVGALTGGISTLFGAQAGVSDAEQSIAQSADAEAKRKAAETRLQYVEQALADAQDKLKQATSAFEQATTVYANALQNKFARHVAIDQLRIHVKQNILYYMQAIWDHEPPDQRFFRLYNQMVYCPQVTSGIVHSDTIDLGGPDYFANTGTANFAGGTVYSSGAVVNSSLPAPALNGPKVQLVEIADLDNPLGYKGNYIIFPMKGECYLTTYMLTEYIDNYLGLRDPDGSNDFDAEAFDEAWNKAVKDNDKVREDQLRAELIKYITTARRSRDEIIVPTGQLFIEALPGSHPLLEDFKLLHRMEDVRKVKAEVRHAELENLRLASRLVKGQHKAELLQDPEIEKQIIIRNGKDIVVPPDV
jgi:hypothetical protein